VTQESAERRIALVVNPFASSVTEPGVRAVERVLMTAGLVQTRLTERRGHGIDLVRGAVERGVDAIVVYSGDGGFNEAINGAERDVPLGFVPGGGTSVLPRVLGLPRHPIGAAEQIADAIRNDRSRRISLGRVNGRRFAFNAGLGLPAEAVRRIEALGRKPDGRRRGDLTFTWVVFRLIAERRGRYEPSLEVLGLGRASMVLVANTDPYTFAGPIPLHAAPEATFEAGLDLIAPGRVTPRDVPRLVAAAFGGARADRFPGTSAAHDLDRIEVVCDTPTALQADGEDLGDVAHARFEAERDALTVLV
jgi:diacylglycerol kinase family enzyme